MLQYETLIFGVLLSNLMNQETPILESPLYGEFYMLTGTTSDDHRYQLYTIPNSHVQYA